MNNEHHFYHTKHAKGGITAEQLIAAGIVVPVTKGALALEDEMIAVMGYDKAVEIIREAWKTGVLEMTVCIKLQRALNAWYAKQDLADFAAEPQDDPRAELQEVR